MKITLNELRQIVRKIISESYNLNSIYPYYVEVTSNGIDEEYFNVEEDGKLVGRVVEMIENKIDYKVTGSVDFYNRRIDSFDDVYKDTYENGYYDIIIEFEPLERGYTYSIYKNPETEKYAITVDNDYNNNYFVFFAEKIQNDEEEEYRD